jgi:hypothetical protein
MTNKEIIARLRALSEEMIIVGTAIDYYYGFNPMAAHGKEMVGAGIIAAEWADEMERELE